MTTRIYDNNPLAHQLQATVLSCSEKGGSWLCTFDDTPFFAEGGGQPCDTGTAGLANVTDVRMRDGVIWHTVDQPLTVGQEVLLTIDSARRLDLMQQHSAEHIISGMCQRDYHCNNVGFHLSMQSCHLDLDRELQPEEIWRLEKQVNDFVVQNVPVRCYYPDEHQLPTLVYRNRLERIQGDVRLVDIPGADLCACCGTHVMATGMIGLVKVLDAKRYKGGCRIAIAAGARALAEFESRQQQTDLICRLLSAKKENCAVAVERLFDEKESLKAELASQRHMLTDILIGHATAAGELTYCIAQNIDTATLRALAIKLDGRLHGAVSAALSANEEQVCYVLISEQRDVRVICQALNSRFAGRGGGKRQLAEGSVSGCMEDVVQFLAQQVGG